MAPRHHLLLLVAAASFLVVASTRAPSLLAASTPAHEPPPRDDATAPRAVDDDHALRGLVAPPSVAPAASPSAVDDVLPGTDGGGSLVVPPHGILLPAAPTNATDDVNPAVQRVVHDDVTVIFRAARRLGPARLPAGAYVPIPATADARSPCGAARDGDVSAFANGLAMVFLGAMMILLPLVCLVTFGPDDDEDD